MDEEFHFAQAKTFASFQLHWHPALTTFPGAFVAAACILVWVPNSILVCRLVSGFFTIVLHLELQSFDVSMWSSVELVLMPVLFQVSYLFYTDSGATLFAILTVLKMRRYDINPCWAFVAVAFRQTNIVWVFFAVAERILLDSRCQKDSEILPFFAFCWKNKLIIIQKFKWFLLLAGSFVLFVFLNRGIVLGHQEHHKPVLHLAQLLYFAAFYVVCSPFQSFSTLLSIRWTRFNLIFMATASLLSLYILEYYR
jgi:alpha-1,2-glucosyltransferase